ncbi:MAG: helix-turn-helix transcriptional regulator [Lachnospiraceae bacterium]|nr:helix-turn-helix transcriptional regulator [Lachnospiraceae bacterium]
MSKYYMAENLRRLRTFYDYRQKEVADQLHISRQAYSNYERGTRMPDMRIAVRLAEFYQITLDCLVLAKDPVKRLMDQTRREYKALTPVGSLIPISGPETKMLLRYKRLSREEQEGVQEFVRFREEHLRKKNRERRK